MANFFKKLYTYFVAWISFVVFYIFSYFYDVCF